MQHNGAVRIPATSFILRIWTDEGDGQMRGEIEHIGTGERRLFLNSWSLIRMIEEWRAEGALVG